MSPDVVAGAFQCEDCGVVDSGVRGPYNDVRPSHVGNERRRALAWIEARLDPGAPAPIRAMLEREAGRIRRDLELLTEGNEDGSNRDVPPFDNDPRTDDEIKQAVYDAADDWDEAS